jgi:uncharacterized membrane protein
VSKVNGRRLVPLSWAVTLLGCLAMAQAAQAGNYTFTTIPLPGLPAGDNPGALSINDVGSVVLIGGSATADDVTTIYNIHSHTYTPIPGFPGAPAGQTAPSAINNAGQIVGNYFTISIGSYQGFLLSGGSFTTIAPPQTLGTNFSEATGINNTGQIVGGWAIVSNHVQGFVLSGSFYTTLNAAPPATNATVPVSINDLGQIVGITGVIGDPSGAVAGFLYSGGIFTPINAPGALVTFVNSINNAGVIVGFGQSAGAGFNDGDGFIDIGGVLTPFNVPGALQTQPSSINNLGEIVGAYTDAQGVVHAFLATPVPEPSSALPIVLGLAGLLGLARLKEARRY